MGEHLYPWGGRFTEGNPESPVAVVTLSEDMQLPVDRVALYGNMKTENLGVEKVVANVISNPNIRYVIVCGTEVRGHRSGESLVKLHENGVDANNRVVGAKSAIPYIENLPPEAIQRFREQVELVDLIGEGDVERVMSAVEEHAAEKPGPYGEPMMVEAVAKENVVEVFHTDYALHRSVDVDLYGVVSPMPEVG